MSELSPEAEAYQATLEHLDNRKWDLMDELAAIELAKAAILNRIRGFESE